MSSHYAQAFYTYLGSWNKLQTVKELAQYQSQFSTLSVLITVLCVMISYLFYYRIMTDMAKNCDISWSLLVHRPARLGSLGVHSPVFSTDIHQFVLGFLNLPPLPHVMPHS